MSYCNSRSCQDRSGCNRQVYGDQCPLIQECPRPEARRAVYRFQNESCCGPSGPRSSNSHNVSNPNKGRALNGSPEMQRDHMPRLPQAISNSAEGRPFDPNNFNQIPLSESPATVKGRTLSLSGEIDRGRRMQKRTTAVKNQDMYRRVLEPRESNSNATGYNTAGASRRDRASARSPNAVGNQSVLGANMSPPRAARPIVAASTRQKFDKIQNATAYQQLGAGGGTITRTTVTTTTTRAIPPQTTNYFPQSSSVEDYAPANERVNEEISQQRKQMVIKEKVGQPVTLLSATNSVTYMTNVDGTQMECTEQAVPKVTCVPTTEHTEYGETDDQKLSHTNLIPDALYHSREVELSAKQPHIPVDQCPRFPPYGYREEPREQGPVPNLPIMPIDQGPRMPTYAMREAVREENMCPKQDQCPRAAPPYDRQEAINAKQANTAPECPRIPYSFRDEDKDEGCPMWQASQQRLSCPPKLQENMDNADMGRSCEPKRNPQIQQQMAAQARSFPRDNCCFDQDAARYLQPRPAKTNCQTNEVDEGERCRNAAQRVNTPTSPLNMQRNGTDCNLTNNRTMDGNERNRNALSPVSTELSLVCSPSPPSEAFLAAIYRFLTNKFSSTFDYISSLVTSQKPSTAINENTKNLSCSEPSRPSALWGPYERPQTGWETLVNDCRNHFLQANQTNRTYMFQTSSRQVASHVHNPQITDSMRECADAMRCGRLPSDTLDRRSKSPQKAELLKSQVENLVADKYCPGLIQETIDGIDDFNGVSITIAINTEHEDCLDPMTLLEAFALRLDRERKEITAKIPDDATEGMINETVNTHFASQYPTELNRSLRSFIGSELVTEFTQTASSQSSPFTADVEKAIVNLNIQNSPMRLETYVGQCKSN